MLSIKGVDPVQKIQCSNFNAKESTTYIGTISKNQTYRVYQLFDRKIFGIVKAKLKSKNILSGDPKKRHQEIHKAMNQIWSEISTDAINSAWNISELNKYTYTDPDDKNDMDYNPKKK